MEILSVAFRAPNFQIPGNVKPGARESAVRPVQKGPATEPDGLPAVSVLQMPSGQEPVAARAPSADLQIQSARIQNLSIANESEQRAAETHEPPHVNHLISYESDEFALEILEPPQFPAAAYIGSLVEVESDTLELSGGPVRIAYALTSDADNTRIEILDDNGDVVRTLAGNGTAGRHELAWDGKDDAGNDLPDGLYGFRVSALDGHGNDVSVTQSAIGRVTGIQEVDGETFLRIGNLLVSTAQILDVIEVADIIAGEESRSETSQA